MDLAARELRYQMNHRAIRAPESDSDVREIEDRPPADRHKIEDRPAPQPVVDVAGGASQGGADADVRRRMVEDVSLTDQEGEGAEDHPPEENQSNPLVGKAATSRRLHGAAEPDTPDHRRGRSIRQTPGHRHFRELVGQQHEDGWQQHGDARHAFLTAPRSFRSWARAEVGAGPVRNGC